LGTERRVFYADSLSDRDKRRWQPLAAHLHAVADAAGARGAKFGAGNAAALSGLMHDLGKYSLAFQRRVEGASERVDHSTARAQQVIRCAGDADSKVIAKVIAHAIAGHHAGLPDTIGDEASLNARLKRDVEALDPAWLKEISPVVADLMPAIDWGDRKSLAYRLAFFGRMIFSCLVTPTSATQRCSTARQRGGPPKANGRPCRMSCAGADFAVRRPHGGKDRRCESNASKLLAHRDPSPCALPCG
jgi:CRISPR-associated endonuclease/helicase Cas3